MSYNTRRGGAGGYSTAASNVGQRRANNSQQQQQQQQQLGNNFVAGGQLTQPIKPLLQMPAQQSAQRQQATPQQKPAQQQQMEQRQKQQQNLRQQAQQFLAQQQQQQPQPLMQQAVPQPAQQQPVPQQTESLAVQQAKIEFKAEEKPMDNANGTDVGGGDSEDGSERRSKKNKPFWMRKDGKINKKERLRRRNQRLRKILQPKNALMVLNELIGSAPYNMTENADIYEGTIFKCTVLVDGLEHVGMGKSKPSAKTAAAEAALKHMVLSKLKTAQSLEPNSLPVAAAAAAAAVVTAAAGSPVEAVVPVDGEIKMDIDGEDNLGGISWSHVACYALHKLLSSWDEGSNLAEKLARTVAGSAVTMSGASVTISESLATRSTNEHFNPLLQLAQAASGGSITASDKAKTFEKKPAKKLPDSAASMNPIMLLNQMHPNAIYEEVSKSGHTPNVQFTVRCTVNGEPFVGRGSTKKGARKMCAFAACKKVLGIQYDSAFLEQHGFSEDAVGLGNNVAPAAPMAIE